MKKSCIFWMFALQMLVIGMSGCSSKDEDSQDPLSDYCYTGIIKAIHPVTGSVQVVITESPKIDNGRGRPIRRDEILFKDKELTNSILQVDDIIEFKIIYYELVNRVGGYADDPLCYVCKVKPCK